MQRLVYSPKVYAFVRSSEGTVLDISPYIVDGTVNRRINQVSSAEIQLRNPQRMFTQPGNPTFHPMDPITIFLERVKDFPIRVFTGFLDRTPYYQLFPGIVKLTASCTLKKLLYTYFDPALPYTRFFMQEYGWIDTGQGTLISYNALNETNKDKANQKGTGQSNPDKQTNQPAQLTAAPADNKKQKDGTPATSTSQDKPAEDPWGFGPNPKDTHSKDGSIGELLFATLKHIGGWPDDQIHIEALPSDLINRMVLLYAGFKVDNDAAKDEFTKFMHDIIGSAQFGAAGAGLGTDGLVSGPTPKQIFCYYVQNGFSEAGAAAMVGNADAESSFNPKSENSIGAYGLFQWLGSRRSNLEAFAKKRGKPSSDIETQLAFARSEGIDPSVKNASDPCAAAIKFEATFEKSGGALLERRCASARAALRKFKGTCGNADQNAQASHPPGGAVPSAR